MDAARHKSVETNMGYAQIQNNQIEMKEEALEYNPDEYATKEDSLKEDENEINTNHDEEENENNNNIEEEGKSPLKMKSNCARDESFNKTSLEKSDNVILGNINATAESKNLQLNAHCTADHHPSNQPNTQLNHHPNHLLHQHPNQPPQYHLNHHPHQHPNYAHSHYQHQHATASFHQYVPPPCPPQVNHFHPSAFGQTSYPNSFSAIHAHTSNVC